MAKFRGDHGWHTPGTALDVSSRATARLKNLGDWINPRIVLASIVVIVIGSAIVGLTMTGLSRTTSNAQKEPPAPLAASPLSRSEEATDQAGATEPANRPVVRLIQGPGGDLEITIRAARPSEAGWASITPPERGEASKKSDPGKALREAQAAQPATVAAQQLREAQQGSVSSTPQETQQALATTSPTAREQPRDPEFDNHDIGESSNKKEITPAEAKGPDMGGPQLAKVQARPGQEGQNPTRDVWDCRPRPPTGNVVCHASAQKPTSNKAATAKKPDPKKAANQQTWDCQPAPPSGQYVCRPMAVGR
jgi:hypothetical protein